jgi:hypothetical protein
MKLIIYDTAGKIFAIFGDSYAIPAGGLQYLEVEIPEGKMITGVDVSVTPNVPIFTDYPKSEEVTRIELLESAVNDMLLSSTI